MKVHLKTVLNARLASMRGAGITCRVKTFQIIDGQRPHIANGVSDGGPIRIVAQQARPKVYARESWSVNGEYRDLLIGHAQLQRDRFEARTTACQLFQLPDVLVGNQIECSKSLQRVVDVCDLFRNQFELVSGEVFRKYPPAPVVNEAAYRRHSFNSNTIALRSFGKMFVVKNL